MKTVSAKIPPGLLFEASYCSFDETKGLVGLLILRNPYDIDRGPHIVTHQTGGYACNHPSAEGWFDLIENSEALSQDLESYFVGEKHKGWCCNGIDEEDVDVIDSMFMIYIPENHIRIDRSRTKDCQEAWLFVNIGEEKHGILMFANSD